MQISNNHPEFIKSTLLLVTSRQDAKAFHIKDREASQLFSFHYNTPEYTDKEGSFNRSGKDGRRQGGGETDINVDKIAYTEFLNELNQYLDKADLDDVEEVVLYASDHLYQQTREHLPKSIQDKITKVIKANVIHEDLNQLVTRINE